MIEDNSLKTIFTACIIVILLGGMIIPLAKKDTTSVDISMYNRNTGFFNGEGKTLYVGGSGPDNYTRIQDAIDNASDGDAVFVYDDSSPYYENIVIGKSISVIGENEETTIIDGSMEGQVISIISDYVAIKSFTIRNSDESDTGVQIDSSHTSISNCIIYSNYRAIMFSSHNNTISYSHIYNNSYGLQFKTNFGSNIISNCNISKNNYGISLAGSRHNIITNNIIYQNKEGIYSDGGSENSIENNHFILNGEGIHTHGPGNEVKYNTFLNNGEGISLSESGKNTIYNNSFFNDGISIGGKVFESYSRNRIVNNTLNGKPILYLQEQSNIIIDETIEAGQILLVKSNNITITHQNIADTCLGIRIWDCNNCHVHENNISNSIKGIWLQDSRNNIINHNNFKNNNYHDFVSAWKGVYFNNWNRNYWDDWPGFIPRALSGIRNMDWCPRVFPYEWWWTR